MTKIRGRVVRIFPIEAGTNKQGNPWRKLTALIDQPTNGEPIPLCIIAFGENADQLNLQEGYDYELSVTIKSREYNGKYYTDVVANYAQPIGCVGYPPQAQYGGTMGGYQQPYQPQTAPQGYGVGGYQQGGQQPYQQQSYQQPQQTSPYGGQPMGQPQVTPTQPQQPYGQAQQPVYNQPSAQSQVAPIPQTGAPQQGVYQPQATPAPQQGNFQQPATQPTQNPSAPQQPYEQAGAPQGSYQPQAAPMPQGAIPNGVNPNNDDLPF